MRATVHVMCSYVGPAPSVVQERKELEGRRQEAEMSKLAIDRRGVQAQE